MGKWHIITIYPFRDVLVIELGGRLYSSFETAMEAREIKERLEQEYECCDFAVASTMQFTLPRPTVNIDED